MTNQYPSYWGNALDYWVRFNHLRASPYQFCLVMESAHACDGGLIDELANYFIPREYVADKVACQFRIKLAYKHYPDHAAYSDIQPTSPALPRPSRSLWARWEELPAHELIFLPDQQRFLHTGLNWAIIPVEFERSLTDA